MYTILTTALALIGLRLCFKFHINTFLVYFLFHAFVYTVTWWSGSGGIEA